MTKKNICLLLTAILLVWMIPGFAEKGEATVALPSALSIIEAGAFEGDAALEKLTIPGSVESIGSRAFAKCGNLSEVVFESKDIEIASDAFDETPVTFVVDPGSAAEQYALAHGIPVRLKTSADSFSSMALDMVLERGKPESGLMGEVFASERLMVQTENATLPNISQYQPAKILAEGTGFFLIQFDSIEQASLCHDYLNTVQGVIAEPDAFVTVSYSAEDEVSAASLNDKWENPDVMGLSVYSAYIQKKYPNASATVAVIDSGIAYHSALNDHVLEGYDFTGQDNPRYDDRNHGTGVAGCIVDAVYGANVKILPIRIFSDNFMTTSMVREAIKKAIECAPDVINISAVISKESAIVRNMLQRCEIPVVVSAGNGGASCDNLFPASLTNVITVSGIDTNMSRDTDSNYGAAVDYCAPSTNISSYTQSGGTYDSFAGTSYAAPQISAAIALISMDPERSVADMQSVCVDLGAVGRDDYYGWGLPDLSLFSDKVRRIDITNETPSVLEVGGTCVLMYDVIPASAEDKTVSISCSDSNVLSVTKTADGILRIVGLGQGKGHVTITAQDGSGVSVTSADITVVQPVNKVSIAAPASSVNLANAGETLGLSVSVQPSDATNKDVVWSSLDESIATVAQNGVVTPVAVGKVKIRATAVDGYGAYAEFEVTVIAQRMPEGIAIDLGDDDAQLEVGETKKLKAVIDPEDAVQTVTWYSTNKSVLDVTEDGTITAKAPGRAVLMVTSMVDSTLQHHEEFFVIQPPLSLEFSVVQGEDDTIEVGSFLQLSAVVMPENADDRRVIWKSSNENVATVDQTGKVSGVASGVAKITAVANGNAQLVKEYPITVRQLPAQINILGDAYVYTGASRQLTAVVLPENADDKSVVWSSSNPEVATVNNTGLVTGKKNGVTMITVRSNALPGLTQTISMEVYPEWEYSDWVTADQVPENGIVTDRKWTYTETCTQSTSTLNGWTLTKEEWAPVSSGSVRWVNFAPYSGFDKNNALYKAYNVSAPSASETATTKRVVSTAGDGYIYWHWMYDCGSGNATNRSIFYKNDYGSSTLTGNSFYYKYFGAFESATAYEQMDAGKNWGQSDTYYLWYKVSDRTSYASSQGSYWWYRIPINKTSYTDYNKVYHFSRNVEVTSEPAASANVTNVVAYVKYKVANTANIKLSGWVTEDQVPAGAEIVENKWTYKETISSNSESMAGWNQVSSTWKKAESNAVRWVDFSAISGFSKSNSLYITYNKPAPKAMETATTKRVIDSEINDGYLYWHWMYNTSSANAGNRAIFYKNAYGSSTLTGNDFYYKYFGAFESKTAYEQMDAGKNWGQSDTYYLWYKVSDRTSFAASQGSYWWYRTQIKKTSYTDYYKEFTYSRTMTTTTEPTASETVSDITKLVRYLIK